jgi:hypothetical protein
MAVQVQFITIVVPIERINTSTEPGGFTGLLQREADSVGKCFWHDKHLYATAVMSPMDAQYVMKHWEAKGLVARTSMGESRRWKDLCVVDYYQGPTLPCDWLEWDAASHSVWHKGTERGQLIKPDDQHEANPIFVTPAMMQTLGKSKQAVGAPPLQQHAKKAWWKLW